MLLNNLSFGLPYDPDQDRIDEFFRDSGSRTWRADSLADLAAAADLPAESVMREIERFNSGAEQRIPADRFGRDVRSARPIKVPPFFAIEYMPLIQKNLGGVETDLSCRVLDEQGDHIGGVYAAGELAGMAGGRINGRAGLEGTMFGPCVFSGIVAGRAAAANGLLGPCSGSVAERRTI
jgi:succinate dehydrogenase/fumarate reductase flavoprotein subunit